MSQQALWNERAQTFGCAAGNPNDLIAKELELRAIVPFVQDGIRVLDLGCGTGELVCALVKKAVGVTGMDFSSEMLVLAQRRWEERYHGPGAVFFVEGNVLDPVLPDLPRDCAPPFDVIITERCLINLTSHDDVRHALLNISQWLRPGGRYLMCESSQEGLDEINEYRRHAGLPEIIAPAHTRYLSAYDLRMAREILGANGLTPREIAPFSGDYYFLSRVLNAWQAQQDDKEPDYQAPINQLALTLPRFSTLLGQVRLWVWEKEG